MEARTRTADQGAAEAPQPTANHMSEHQLLAFAVDLDPTGRQPTAASEATVVGKLNRNLLWTFSILVVLCYIDRTNLSFAALALNEDLGFSDRVYGTGSGMFFVGYLLFQVPSNLVLVRIGARRWLAAIILAWGLVAALFAVLRTPWQFYVLRFLLGIAESGTFPGMWFHLTLFYSKDEMSLAWSWMMLSVVVSQLIGAPLAAGILALNGALGLRGWQWLFLLEGLPTLGMAAYIFCTLAESPLQAGFLTQAEREWLSQRQARQKVQLEAAGAQSTSRQAMCNMRVWYNCTMKIISNIHETALLFWLPLLIQSVLDGGAVLDGKQPAVEGAGASNQTVALLCLVPFTVSAIAIYAVSRHSKATGERKLHVAVPWAAGCVVLLCLAETLGRTAAGAYVFVSLSTVPSGGNSVVGAWPATYVSGPAAATAAALINSVGSIGGIVGPVLVGELTHRTGSYALAMVVLAAVALIHSIMAANFPELADSTSPSSPETDAEKVPGEGSPHQMDDHQPLVPANMGSSTASQ
ncbi:hypothetical protein WJX72_003413 [[Myrmecia] bisecta]|uniref:Major facilitator superfamily (MFS) profile domain-containing protein n=1 Tax=[Myrmecia] bisecta TaxID=41462 RepID=A0AAW1R6C8_9CHLO